MDTFLQFVGAVFLALILLIVGGVLLIRFYLRRALGSLKGSLEELSNMMQFSTVPPRIHLRKQDNLTWENQGTVERQAQALHELGFQPADTYQVEEIGGLQLQAFTKVEDSLYAIIYEQPAVGVWMDYVTRYEDGTSITCSNAPKGHELEHRPGHDKIYDREADAVALYHRMMQERPQRPFKNIMAEDFVTVFEKAYADEMDWRNSRGGATEAEIRRIAADSGTPVSDEEIAAQREMNLRQACAGLEVALRERFLAETTMSAAEWERVEEYLIFVHDRMTPEMVGELFDEHRYYNEDDEDDEDYVEPPSTEVPEGVSAREAFRLMNLELEPQQRFEKLAELAAPVPADVYRAPTTE